MDDAIILFFEKIVDFGIPLFTTVSLLLFVFSLWKRRGIVSKKADIAEVNIESVYRNVTESRTASLLQDLSAPVSDNEQKANAFVGLMKLGYVLLHKMINDGEKYDDHRQYDLFVKFLSSEVVDSLNKLNGADRI